MKKQLRAFCNRCNRVTNHNIKSEFKTDEWDEIEIDGIIEDVHYADYNYQILECGGCDSVSFRIDEYYPNFLSFDSRTNAYQTGPKKLETFFPERKIGQLTEKKIIGLPNMIHIAYREIIDSYNLNLLILCSAGLRAIVEAICKYYKINAKFLKNKIDGLSQSGLISRELGESLKIHKFLGDSALHRLDIPDKKELESAINLIELTMETLFDVPDRHQRLKELVTRRVAEK